MSGCFFQNSQAFIHFVFLLMLKLYKCVTNTRVRDYLGNRHNSNNFGHFSKIYRPQNTEKTPHTSTILRLKKQDLEGFKEGTNSLSIVDINLLM